MNVLSSYESLKCSKHKNKIITFIQVNQEEDNKNIFYCDLCILYDQKFKSPDYVYIQQIIESSNNSHIVNWPPIEDEHLKNQIFKMQTQEKKQNKLESQINQYFDNLRTEINSQIDSCQKNMIQKALKPHVYEELIIKKLQENQMADEFKTILMNCKDDISEKERLCRELIDQVNQQKANYTEQLKEIFDKLSKNESKIDFQIPNQIKTSILQLIQTVNFFIEDENINKEDQLDSNYKNNQDIQNQQKVDKLIDLISVKSNFLTNNFIYSIKKLLKQISPLINEIPFDEVHSNNSNPINFSKLCDQQMETIRNLVEYYTEQQTNQNLIEQIKKLNQFQQISSILNNKTNYLQKRFIDEFEKYIIETYPLFNKINFNNLMNDDHQFQMFFNIKDEDLLNMCELYKKKKELEQNNNLWNNSQSYKINIQISSKLSQYKKQDLDSLLQKYPIYDIIQPLKNIDMLPNLQLIKSNYNTNSQHIEINKIENNAIQITSPNGNGGSYYSNVILDRNDKYIFRFQFKKHKKEGERFSIGLVRDETKDTDYSLNDKLSCYFYFDNIQCGLKSGYGIDKCIKGDLRDIKYINRLELRVCIKDELLELFDYPNYDNKYILNNENKNNLKEYQNLKLGIFVQNEIEVTLISSQIIEQFEN